MQDRYVSIRLCPVSLQLVNSTTNFVFSLDTSNQMEGFQTCVLSPKTLLCSNNPHPEVRKTQIHNFALLKTVSLSFYQLQPFLSSVRTLRPKRSFQGLTKLFMLTRRRPCLRSVWPATRYSTPKELVRKNVTTAAKTFKYAD